MEREHNRPRLGRSPSCQMQMTKWEVTAVLPVVPRETRPSLRKRGGPKRAGATAAPSRRATMGTDRLEVLATRDKAVSMRRVI
jgi:hypothetical protein